MPSEASASTIILLVLTLGLGQAPGASAPAAAPIPASFFGITVPALGTTWPVTVPFGTLGKTASGGPPGDTYWVSLEPSNGTYDWTPLDNLVARAKSAGITSIVYTLYETPAWASSKATQSCFATQKFGILGCAAPPEYLSDWDTFVTALATRYKGEIQYYELWNEPNVPSEYSGNVSEMVTLARHAYDTIKSIDPAAMVLTPGVSVAGIAPYSPGCSPGTCWLAEYLQDGGGDYADGVAFHGKTCLADNSVCAQEGIACPKAEIESCAGSSLVAQIDAVRSLMATYGISSEPLINTEGGYADEVGQQNLWGTADQQTAFLSRFFMIQAGEGIKIVVWFSWLANRQSGLTGFGTSAAEQESNQAYGQMHDWLLGASFNSPCSLSEGLWTCDITSPAGYQELAVWADTNSSGASYSPEGRFTQYKDLGGATHQVPQGSSIALDEKPMLLESGSTSTSSTTATTASSSSSSTARTISATSSASTTSSTGTSNSMSTLGTSSTSGTSALTVLSSSSSNSVSTAPASASGASSETTGGSGDLLLYGGAAIAVVAIAVVVATVLSRRTWKAAPS
jgi:Beta-galactosidase